MQIDNNPYLALPYKILSIQRETEIDWTFTIAFDAPLVGGQFMQLSIPGVGEAPISISDFSPASDKSPGLLHMTIRKVGRLTDSIFELVPGDMLFMRGPYGNGFDVSLLKDKHVTIITGGTGTAPVKSVIRSMVYGSVPTLSARIVCGFKSPSDVLYKENLSLWQQESLGTKTNILLTIDRATEDDTPWSGEVGLVTSHIPSLGDTEQYGHIDPLNAMAIVVGPPMMMKFTTLGLIKAGYLPENIIVSFERNMSCAIGKCGHCKIDETYVCLEGPVFNYVQAAKLLD